MFSNLSLKKRAQTGSTLTWIVATLIIVVILLVTLFVAGNLGKNKSVIFVAEKDTLASKSFFAWLSTAQESGIIYDSLKNEESLDNYNGELAQEIFEEYYQGEYREIWIGMVVDRRITPYVPNDFFGHRPTSTSGGDISQRFVDLVTERAYLNENKSIELTFKKDG